MFVRHFNKIPLVLVCLLFNLYPSSAIAQIVWTDISAEQKLPEGIRLFSGKQTNPAMVAYYTEIDLKRKEYIVHPYFSENFRSTSAIASEKGAIIAVNGGYFSSSGSTSAVVEPNEVKANNIAALSRSGVVFPVTRSFFAINSDQSLSIDWIYHFSDTMDGIIKYANPTPNTTTSPAATPRRENGTAYDKLLMGLGGGPTLIKNGVIRITHDEEVFFGSGIDWTSPRARTAVGFTDDQKLILLIVEEGSANNSVGATLQQLAEILLSLGAKQAMNLDGGGSTTLSVKGSLFSRPQGGTFQRPMPSILAVVPSDSLKVADGGFEPVIIDTEMKEVSFSNNGQGWGSTANAGYYGSSVARIALIGDGSTFVTYKPSLEPGKYQVYGWWVSSSNRAPNTPYTIYHANGQAVQRVNQQLNSSRWVSLGTYDFKGMGTDSLRISNNASASSAGANQTYIVADAVRFVKMATNTSIKLESDRPFSFNLKQNYPNPFNPSTMIEFELREAQMVSIKVYDVMGRHLRTLLSERMPSGTHRVSFNGSGLSSGAYIYKMETPDGVQSRMMSLVK
jgi:hypothetical protein